MTCARLFPLSLLLVFTSSWLPAQIQFPGQGSPFPGGGGRGGGIPGRKKKDDSANSKDSKKKNDAVVTISTTGFLRLLRGSELIFEADEHRIITYRTNAETKATKDGKSVELSSFAVADHLTVDANQDDEGYFTATGVTFSSSGTSEERYLAARTWDLPDPPRPREKTDKAQSAKSSKSDDDDGRPTLRRSDASGSDSKTNNTKAGDTKTDTKSSDTKTSAANASPADDSARPDDAADLRPKTTDRPADAPPDSDDPGKPQLRRGVPVKRASEQTATAASSQTAAPVKNSSKTTLAAPQAPTLPPQEVANRTSAPESAIPVEEDPIIVKAKQASADYTGTLPNYLVKQSTTRYDQQNPREGWQAHDMVTADVKYEDGTQSYTNVKVGNKSVKSIEDTGGNWSTGEFATLLEDLFDPSTGARFRRSGQETLRGRFTYIFKYEVPRERSHWRIITTAQIYYPAYRGTIWVDKETSRVLRLEMESRGVPLQFPIEKVEEASDYDLVRLAAAKPFLLPTVSEVLSCWHASSVCTRNHIEFRNYHKFGAESDVTFDDDKNADDKK